MSGDTAENGGFNDRDRPPVWNGLSQAVAWPKHKRSLRLWSQDTPLWCWLWCGRAGLCPHPLDGGAVATWRYKCLLPPLQKKDTRLDMKRWG